MNISYFARRRRAALRVSQIGLSLTALTLPALDASAQTALSSPRTSVIFYTENDDWPPDTGSDKDYTNGFRVTLDRNSDLFHLRRWAIFKWIPERPPCAQAARSGPTSAATRAS